MSRAPRASWARRNWGTDDSNTPILHVDMDAFFVSVELLDRPELAGQPVAVGGAERGVVSAASYEARTYGVNSAMPVGQAKRLCPQLLMLPPNGERYREVSRAVMSILDDYTPLREQVSVDEAFLDVSGARRIFGSPVRIAQSMRERIRSEQGVPASVGIAATKHVAKIASAHAKPDGLLLIPQEATLPFLHTLPVGSLWGVGERTRERLDKQGVERVGDLAALGEHRLTKLLGDAQGKHLYALAMGVDPRPVTPSHAEKSIGKEVTLFERVSERSQIEAILLDQAHATARRLRERELLARSVAIKVRFGDFTTISRSKALASPSNVAQDIYLAAKRLLEGVNIPADGLRLIGLRAEQMVRVGEGIQTAWDDDPRRLKAEGVMDLVGQKFGHGAIAPASLLTHEGSGSHAENATEHPHGAQRTDEGREHKQ
ncbi:DNA polymerase IV [Ancrocorticia sp.]|uniref:DNA polymerase IV n=1 Tax=Ancrocorticia sp. TaxID=2593684 RepID=UPI003F8D92F2